MAACRHVAGGSVLLIVFRLDHQRGSDEIFDRGMRQRYVENLNRILCCGGCCQLSGLMTTTALSVLGTHHTRLFFGGRSVLSGGAIMKKRDHPGLFRHRR